MANEEYAWSVKKGLKHKGNIFKISIISSCAYPFSLLELNEEATSLRCRNLKCAPSFPTAEMTNVTYYSVLKLHTGPNLFRPSSFENKTQSQTICNQTSMFTKLSSENEMLDIVGWKNKIEKWKKNLNGNAVGNSLR